MAALCLRLEMTASAVRQSNFVRTPLPRRPRPQPRGRGWGRGGLPGSHL